MRKYHWMQSIHLDISLTSTQFAFQRSLNKNYNHKNISIEKPKDKTE